MMTIFRRGVAFGRANDLDAEYAESPARVVELARERNAKYVIHGRARQWPGLESDAFPRGVAGYALPGEEKPGFAPLASAAALA